MDEKQKNHKNSKIEHVFRDEESIRLLSEAFRGSFIERLILAILAALTIFGGFAVVAWAWHGDVSDKRLQSELTERNNIIQHNEEKIKELSDVQIAFDNEGTHLRNMLDKKVIVCKTMSGLSNDEQLEMLSEQFDARERYVSALYRVVFTYPNLPKEIVNDGIAMATIYSNNINLPCHLAKSSNDLNMVETQRAISQTMLYEIQKRRRELDDLINEKTNILIDKLFSN